MMKRLKRNNAAISDYLSIQLDDDYSMKGEEISLRVMCIYLFRNYAGVLLPLSYDAHFDENLRSQIIEAVIDNEETQNVEQHHPYFSVNIKNAKECRQNITMMNELGVLGAFLPEFKDMVGYFQPGVYHCYTAMNILLSL